MSAHLIRLIGVALAAGLARSGAQELEPEPRVRTLARELSARLRLAGTSGSERAARFVADHLAAAGLRVELDRRVVLLSLPRAIDVEARVADARGALLFEHHERFDPDELPPREVPKCSAWSASGVVEGRVLDVGRGLAADFAALAARDVDPRGRIALARYGGAYRGVKVELAAASGCAGVLLFSDPEEDGSERGPTWPAGPWKPGWDAQRGSILPLGRAPGDPSTPGFASPPPGVDLARIPDLEIDARLPRIPCTPIGADDARTLLALDSAGGAWVRLAVDAPRTLRTIVNVVGWLDGPAPRFAVLGNHRDAWVHGAHDAGSGTVALLRAAELLAEKRSLGWRPKHSLAFAFWDAEEQGLIGSTEWGEAHAELLRDRAVAYVNADTAVSGLRFGASGAPGFSALLASALERVAAPAASGTSPGTSLLDAWTAASAGEIPRLGLPGAGSDFTVFLHHLGLPVLDVSLSGAEGGQYHTAIDDFSFVDRFIDPTWQGHATAAALLAELAVELSARGRGAFDDAEAARALAALARESGAETDPGHPDREPWLGPARAESLALAFDDLALAIGEARAAGVDEGPALLQHLEAAGGLAGRPWFKNRLWAPSLATGYEAETWPSLRAAARTGAEDLERELSDLASAVSLLASEWRARASAGAGAGAAETR